MSVFSDDLSGILAAMRISYDKHLKRARKGRIGAPSDPPHYTALFGALGSRNQIIGRSTNEVEVWLELSPFLHMKKSESIAALGLYAAYREIPEDIGEEQKAKLADDLNKAVIVALNKEPERIKAIVDNQFPFVWIDLLPEKTRDRIRKT